MCTTTNSGHGQSNKYREMFCITVHFIQVIGLQESGGRVLKAESSLQQARDAKCVATVKALAELDVASTAHVQTFLEGLT